MKVVRFYVPACARQGRIMKVDNNGRFALVRTNCGERNGLMFMMSRMPYQLDETWNIPWFTNALRRLVPGEGEQLIAFKTLAEAQAWCDSRL